MDKTEGIIQIERLVRKYESSTAVLLKKQNESMTSKDFILPLFQALGWDVYNNFGNEVTSKIRYPAGVPNMLFTFEFDNDKIYNIL